MPEPTRRNPDDGELGNEPDQGMFEVDDDAEAEKEEELYDETRENALLHEPRSETSPPVTGVKMPL